MKARIKKEVKEEQTVCVDSNTLFQKVEGKYKFWLHNFYN